MSRGGWILAVVLGIAAGVMAGYLFGRGADEPPGPDPAIADILDRVGALEEGLEKGLTAAVGRSAESDVMLRGIRESVDDLKVKVAELAASRAATAASTDPLMECGFEDTLDGWAAPELQFGKITIAGDLAITNDAPFVRVGNGAAAWSYEVGAEQASAMNHELALPGPITRFSCWLRSQQPTLLVVELKEQDESKYTVVINIVEPDQWQHIERAAWAFKLSDDSEDENGRLDADRIVAITIIDPTGILGTRAGPNTVYIDDLKLK